MNPPPPNNNDNDNEDAAAAAAIIPLVEDGHDDEDDEEEEGGIGSDEDGEEDNIEDDNFGPPVPEDHHSDDDDEDDDEGGNNDEDNGVDVNNEDENNGDEVADADDDFIYDPVEQERICQEAVAILLNRLNFPSPQRDRSIVRFAQHFITNVKEDIHKTLTDMRTVNEGYDGLDSDRDTEAEVETAIRCDPNVLTRRDDQFGLYPIQCVWFTQIDDNTELVCNVKAASFVHLFVMLAIEFNSFQDEERGGLLVEDTRGYNVLQDLARASLPSSYDEEHQRHVDTTCVAVLIRLRRSGYLVKKDIQKYELVHKLCRHRYISEQRFCFLIKWDPSALLQPNANNKLPLHWVADNLEDFQFVLDLLFRFYPRWKGINALFTIDNDGDTPFELACDKLTQNKVTEVVEEILIRYTTNNGLVNTNYSSNGNALILAAIDDTVSLDGVYFIIRRQPDTMLSMLHHPREEEDEDEDEESKTIVSSLSLSNSNNNSNNSIAHRNNNNNQHTTDSSTANDNHGTEDGHHNENKSNNGNDISNGGNASFNNNHNNGIVSRIIRKRKRN